MKLLRITSIVVLLFLIAGDIYAVPGSGQGHFRWRNDDGSETTATWMVAEDIATTAGPGYNFRLRIEIWNMFSTLTPTVKLTFSTNTGGPWTDITTDGSVNAFKITPSTNFTDGDGATNQLTNFSGYGATVHSGGRMTDISTSFAISLAASASQEFEWSLQATANAVHNTTYYFSIRKSDNSALQTYYNYPSLTFDQALPVELAAFTAYQQGKNVQLAWTTASESNNLGFILERRVNQAEWQTIASYLTHAELKGIGNATTSTQYQFTDNQAPEGTTCEYHLLDVDIQGIAEQIGSVKVTVNALPTAFTLEAAYPNPFNPTTNIRYHLAQDGLVKLTVLDMLGRAVKTIENTWLPAGSYTRTWNAVNDSNQPVPSGVYFFRLETANTNLIQKAILIR